MENISHNNDCSCSVCEVLRAEQEEYQNAWDVKAWRTACDITNDIIFILFCVGLIWFFCYLFIGKAEAQEVPQSIGGFSNEEIAQAIFQAEGGYRAKHLYGICSVHYSTLSGAKSICIRTIRHHERLFALQRARAITIERFIKSLGESYCPIKGSNLRPAERALNRYWQKNVMYFLRKDRQ